MVKFTAATVPPDSIFSLLSPLPIAPTPHLHWHAFLLPRSPHATTSAAGTITTASPPSFSGTFPTAAAGGCSSPGHRQRAAGPSRDDDETDAPVEKERSGVSDVRTARNIQRLVLRKRQREEVDATGQKSAGWHSKRFVVVSWISSDVVLPPSSLLSFLCWTKLVLSYYFRHGTERLCR